MPGLVPGIHVFRACDLEDVDGRDEPGHDREADMTPRTATLIGLTAILMWSLLAVLTVASGKIPAFQLAAITFAIGGLVGLLTFIGRPQALSALRQPPLVWAVGVGGLFGYHALYFLALRFAPPAEAGLLNYLWPLLIVVFSSFLPGERLAAHHVIGALAGLAGTVLLVGGGLSGFAPGQLPGLFAAFVAAFVWATYSVMSRRLKAVPTDAVAGFCLATAVLAALMHGLLEQTVWPETAMQWLAVIALGIGPVGAAFYTWDVGMKRGDIRVLGAASYATPLLSTTFLILAGYAKASANIAVAAVLIAGGGLIAAKDLFRKR
jgi:drug/metabolite transporter (DMT)-like permease